MRIWIVENNELHAARAAECVLKVAKSTLAVDHPRSFKIYWDKTIEWKPTLLEMDRERSKAPSGAVNEHPNLVILDLFASGNFLGERFFRSLRAWEASSDTPRQLAWVILWSNKTGLNESDKFITDEPRRDRRVVAPETKGLATLFEKIAGCWRSWEEERNP